MKKIFSLIITTIILFAFTACSNNAVSESDKIDIVCTIFPEYDWVREIIGKDNEDIELTILMNSGVDMHSYQPTVDDIIKVSNCDMLIYVGGESDKWIDDALKQKNNKDMKVIKLLDYVNLKESELVEGMQESEHEHHEEEHEEEHNEEHHHNDEHVWLSLKNAGVLCEKITEDLCEIDVSNADKYRQNFESYGSKLDELDNEYKTMIENSTIKTILFGDRFAFRYLVDDYNLDYYAAFTGCSAETEASFETIQFLAGKIDELKLKYILKLEGSNHKIAETIVSNTTGKNQEILEIISLQAINDKDIANGATYLSIMKDNLEVLTKALN